MTSVYRLAVQPPWIRRLGQNLPVALRSNRLERLNDSLCTVVHREAREKHVPAMPSCQVTATNPRLQYQNTFGDPLRPSRIDTFAYPKSSHKLLQPCVAGCQDRQPVDEVLGKPAGR